MKRFTVFAAFLSVSALVFWAAFQATSEPRAASAAKYDNTPILVYDATGEMLKVIHSGGSVAIAPVYDSTGAMLASINPNKKVTTTPVYDATGAMLQAIYPKHAKAKIAPVYDATRAMLEAINP